MKLLLVSALVAQANALGARPDFEAILSIRAAFGAFKEWTGAKYSALEEAQAFRAFANNQKAIDAHNAGNSTYTLGHNQFSDLTPEEFKERYIGKITENPRIGSERNIDWTLSNATVTDTPIDWVTKGGVTPVKDQGQCGSCWSFSATGALEGAFFAASGKLVALSEQNLVSCDQTDSGCAGGLMDNAFTWIKTHGICSEADYPYISGDGRRGLCVTSCNAVVTDTGFKDVPAADETALLAALQNGPVSVAIEADKAAFHLYKNGILDSPGCGMKLDHGVLVVGYGTDATTGKEYWRVKNSWNTVWGESGYVRMVKGKNMCGIAQQASQPAGATPAAPPTPPPAPTPAPPTPAPPTPPPTPVPPTPVPGTPTPPPTPPAGTKHYGNPANGCLGDEKPQSVGLKKHPVGSICSATCDHEGISAKCPKDHPDGVQAHALCNMDPKGLKNLQCGLSCTTDAMCGSEMRCYGATTPAPPAPATSGMCYYPSK